ncbi:hypothetical protein C0992_007424 [Termitomyces sp. T32_za158]|nr:hypothetical protein C0992_007424 [Termitomyces sp. T32_za158]
MANLYEQYAAHNAQHKRKHLDLDPQQTIEENIVRMADLPVLNVENDFVNEIVDVPQPETTSEPLLEPPPEIGPVGRPKLLELLPDPPAPIVPVTKSPPPNEDETLLFTTQDHVWAPVTTDLNSFGLYREYCSMPTHNPDNNVNFTDMSNFETPSAITPNQSHTAAHTFVPSLDLPSAQKLDYSPFKNPSIFGLMNWMWTGSAMKSLSEVTRLVDFLKSDSFCKEDILDFDVKAETA